MQTIRCQILKILSGFPIKFSEEDVSKIERKISEKFSANKAKNHLGFSYIVTRNWAISQLEKSRYEAKKMAKAILIATEERERQERYLRCKAEFESIVRNLQIKKLQKKQIKMVYASLFEKRSIKECTEFFPNAKYSLLCQWKCRGTKLVTPYASDELKDFLAKGQ